MKYLITYAGQREEVVHASKLVAELIRRGGHEVDIVNLKEKEIDVLAGYDRVLVGGSVWFGKIEPAVKNYILKNKTELFIKPLYLYLLSYLAPDDFKAAVAKQLPLEVLEKAYTFNLGLDVDTEVLNPLTKLRWSLTRQKMTTSFNEQTVRQLADFAQKIF